MQELINELFALSVEQKEQVWNYIQELKKPKRKRSLNANNYCWVLIQKIADKVNSTKEEVYKKYIHEKGIFRTITINNEAVNTITHSWNNNGLGWVCDVIHKGATSTDMVLYYGTSSYNTKQMSNFVDYIVEEAKELGIETLTPDEIEKMKIEWE